MAKKKDSEFRAYAWIESALKDLGWNTHNPSSDLQGQVYTQHECHQNEELHNYLEGGTPEDIVKVKENVYWVIEAKPTHLELDKATIEAENYATKINNSHTVKALFVSGVAGNSRDTYLVKTEYLEKGKFELVTLNGHAVTALLSPQLAQEVLRVGKDVQDVQIDEGLFLSKAEKVNEILHGGGINLKDRAQVISALLLTILDETHPNVDATPDVLIEEINARSRHVLTAQGKPTYHEYVRIRLPATPDNHPKYKNALVRVIQELNGLNIRSAMNSGTDVLGKFYEVFLKYGNGAKEIGIVLTPRHITSFAANVMNITVKDTVYDPCCGTGGFLVAAFDYVKRQNPSKFDLESFKQNRIFGVDQDSQVVTLAIVNMIFRGDGKNNIIEGSCFNKHIVRKNGQVDFSNELGSDEQKVVTRVLMNPPFPSSEAHDKEYEFVDAALGEMQDGGILFSVLPYPTLVKTGQHKAWRKNNLIPKNTLLCVVTFPPDLFYPTASTYTLGIFVKKGIPHPKDQNVLWVRAVYDGTRKSKSKRRFDPKERNDYPRIQDLVRGFLLNPDMAVPNMEQFYKACPIDFNDPNFELVPEYYLDQSAPTIEQVQSGIEEVIRNAAAFLVKEGIEDEYKNGPSS
ncbi:SAM-dependent methyltransferase [Candidatus Bathyarchaeota archaeon]|nr:SAM-dependent methyltransferase [Candidatus Bathyarchaeota archaeon]